MSNALDKKHNLDELFVVIYVVEKHFGHLFVTFWTTYFREVHKYLWNYHVIRTCLIDGKREERKLTEMSRNVGDRKKSTKQCHLLLYIC